MKKLNRTRLPLKKAFKQDLQDSLEAHIASLPGHGMTAETREEKDQLLTIVKHINGDPSTQAEDFVVTPETLERQIAYIEDAIGYLAQAMDYHAKRIQPHQFKTLIGAPTTISAGYQKEAALIEATQGSQTTAQFEYAAREYLTQTIAEAMMVLYGHEKRHMDWSKEKDGREQYARYYRVAASLSDDAYAKITNDRLAIVRGEGQNILRDDKKRLRHLTQG